MTVSAATLGVARVLLSFLPQESALLLGWDANNVIALQIVGALYFGFAIMNWTAKGNLIGGIYCRPLAIGNFTHFIIAAITLIKFAFRDQVGITIIIAMVFYSVFALLFGYVLFHHPTIKIEYEPDDVKIDDFPKA